MKKVIRFIFLCVLMNTLVAMESQKNKQKEFDSLLISMIANNIRNNRVKVEKAYSFEPKLVQNLPMGDLYIPSVDTLEKNNFVGKLSLWNEDLPDNVMAIMPFSTMAYTGLNTQNGSCVSIRNQANNGLVGKYIGMVRYDQKNITGLGFTTDLKYLIATFDNKLVSKTELYSDEEYKELIQKHFSS